MQIPRLRNARTWNGQSLSHECGKDFFVAFSCKTRFFCPSCSQKRSLIWSNWVNCNLLKNLPHRQWVLTIPKILRKLLYRDQSLLSGLADCARDTIKDVFSAKYPIRHYMPGIILSIQPFGDLLIRHPHIHCLVTNSVFGRDRRFHPVPDIDDNQAILIFLEKVFAMLRDHQRISETLISKMSNWNHTGFSVLKEIYIKKDYTFAQKSLGKYITHPSFSQEKIRYIYSVFFLSFKI